MSDISRRTILSGGTAALAAKAYSALQGANERLRLGVIGCGGMANGHMRGLIKMKESDNVEIAAVCDVYQKRLDAARELTNGKAYRDYRALLSDKDIDYVLIATPEHWHYQMIIDAANAEKHIYCEKPMTHAIEEAKKVVQKIRGSKTLLQVGVQGMSDDSYETAQKLVKEGALGKVVVAQIDYSRNHVGDFWMGDLDPDIRPGENLDWNAWLGPAPKRPFDVERFQYWRRYWDYSGGIATDLFVHRVTRIIKSLDLKTPEFVTATGGKFEFAQSKAEIPDTFNALLDYPGGPTVQLVSSMANDRKIDHLLRGHKATLEFTPTGFTITPQRQFENDAKEFVHQKTGAESTDLHHRNLHNAIRKGEPLKCDVNLGFYGVVACDMAVQSYRKRKYLKWDAARERVVNA